MGNRNLDYFVYILVSVCCILCFTVLNVYGELQEKETSEIVNKILKSAKLKEEINLSGASLKEMIGDAPRLDGLKQISLKAYRLDKPPAEEELIAISNAYRENLVPQGWQSILIHNDEDNKMVLIYGKERDEIREKLMTVILMPTELSEMILTGKIELSALEELRRVVLESVPRFNETKPLANFFRPGEKMEIEVKPQPNYMSHPAYQALIIARDLLQNGKNQEALSKYLEVVERYRAEAQDWWQIEAYIGAAKASKMLGDTDKEMEYYKILLLRFGHIDSPELTEAQKNLLMLERGGPLPFLGLGFRHTGSIEGAYIVTVFKNGPCAKAGVQRSDILIAIDNEPTPNPRIVVNIIGRKNVGDTVTLAIKRGLDIIKIPVILMEMPSTLER